MLERDIEKKSCQWAVAQGWMSMKLVSSNHRSVMDRMFVRRGRVVFIEFKTPKGKLTDGQTREIARFRAAGAEVHVARSLEDVKKILTEPGN